MGNCNLVLKLFPALQINVYICKNKLRLENVGQVSLAPSMFLQHVKPENNADELSSLCSYS